MQITIPMLKALRRETRMSYQDIVDATGDIGWWVSLSTVKRVFAAGSETGSFRYDTTLTPIYAAMISIGDPQLRCSLRQAETTSELLELIEGGPQVSEPSPRQSSPDQAVQVTAADIGQYTRAMRAEIEQMALSVVESALLSAFRTLGDAIAAAQRTQRRNAV